MTEKVTLAWRVPGQQRINAARKGICPTCDTPCRLYNGICFTCRHLGPLTTDTAAAKRQLLDQLAGFQMDPRIPRQPMSNYWTRIARQR